MAPTPRASTPPAPILSVATPTAGIPAAATPTAGIPAAATPTAGIPAAATPTAATPTAATPTAGIPTTGAPGAAAPISTGPVAAARPVPASPRPGARDETAALRRIVSLCGHLSALATRDSTLDDVVGFLAGGVSAAVLLLDRDLDVLAHAGFERLGPGSRDPAQVVAGMRARPGSAGLAGVTAAVATTQRALSIPAPPDVGAGATTVVAPVLAGGQVWGHLLTVGPAREPDDTDRQDDTDVRLLVSEHAAMVCGVVLGRDLVVGAAAGRARQELVEGLILARDRDDPDVARWAQYLGFDPARRYCVATVAPGTSTVTAALERALHRLAPDAIVAARTDEVVAIIPGTPARGAGEEALAVVAAAIGAVGRPPRGTAAAPAPSGGLAAGVGSPCSTAAGVARSYTEARHARAARERLAAGGVSAYADLGIHRLLLRVPDVGDLRDFATEVLGPLVDADRATGTAYRTTLSVYFALGSSPRRTAAALHVHPNTVSYRLRRIEEITGLSFDVHRDRLMAEVAVEILDAFGSTT